MATISNIVVEISAKTQKLQQGIRRASAAISDFAKKAAAIGTAVSVAVGVLAVAAFRKLYSAIVDTAEQLDATIKVASNLGIATAELQKLQFQAEQSGISSEQLTRSMQQLLRVTGEANLGSKRAAAAFEDLGLSLRDIRDLDPGQLFGLVIDKLKEVESTAVQAATANVLFGRNWLSVLNLVRSDLDATGKQFDALGIAITQQQSKAVEAFNDARNRLSKIWDSFFVQLTAQTSGAFAELLSWIEQAIIKLGGMKKAAELAASFMLSGIQSVVAAFSQLLTIINDIEIGLKRLEIAALKTRQLGQALKATFGGIFIDTENAAGEQAAAAVLQAEKELNALFKKESLILDSPLAKGLKKFKEELEAPKSFIPSIADFVKENTSANLIDVKKLDEAQAKTNKKTDKYKEKLKKVNEELKKANMMVRQLQRGQSSVSSAGGTSFSQGITALSEILSKANDPNRSTFERSAQQRLFDRSRLQFAGAGSGFDQRREQQKLEVVITTDEAGIITPVVKSEQLNQQVVTVVTRTINQQSRINDR